MDAGYEEVKCSPRERRWVVLAGRVSGAALVLSARAEVGRPPTGSTSPTPSALRASGGGSAAGYLAKTVPECSPRERRWVGTGLIDSSYVRVLSARAEVGLPRGRPGHPWRSALRASGGGSADRHRCAVSWMCSPRERRWVVAHHHGPPGVHVLSARAEVGRWSRSGGGRPRRALRASGGGSQLVVQRRLDALCSPRERRWVDAPRPKYRNARVLSARAEVGRSPPRSSPTGWSALRASGGGSATAPVRVVASQCSPRERRWVVVQVHDDDQHVVLSARAEVGRLLAAASPDRQGALRASGGGSPPAVATAYMTACSPRERRWVAQDRVLREEFAVLSARAEVGRGLRQRAQLLQSALRASGGGSPGVEIAPPATLCSPRERRWVVRARPGGLVLLVLSARAEVGRTLARIVDQLEGALRASGGGSVIVFRV